MISPSELIARADEIDKRLGPISGKAADAIAVQLRRAAARIIEECPEDVSALTEEVERLREQIARMRSEHAKEVREMERDFQDEARGIAAEARHNATYDDPHGTW